MPLQQKPNKIAPDGGWGWIIILGSGLINLCTRAVEPSFGLLFGDTLKELGVATTGAAFIMSARDATNNFSGFLMGPLLKNYSYRKVGILGAILSSLGLITAASATSMTHILLTYSLVGGVGFGLSSTAVFVALNSYFVKRRGQAFGLAMAGTGLGFMLIPQVVSRLLNEYGFHGTMMIMGALGLNAVVGSCLLQPVKWHLKTVIVEEEEELVHERKQGEIKANHLHKSHSSINDDAEASLRLSIENEINKETTNKSKSSNDGCWQKLVSIMDLDLLLDLSFLNTLFGLSMAYLAEINFKLVIPFFMANLGYTKADTAQALSLMAVSDISARLLIPPIFDKLPFTRRSTLAVGLVFVMIARSVLAEQTSWRNLIITILIHGFFRGFALINFPLVISESVVREKLASAYGLFMVSKGIFVVFLGPLAGWIRDFTGSFSICLHAQSVMLLICIVSWSVEYLLSSKTKLKKAQSTEPS
ncbi:monocarboxylate transporter 12-B-like [Macrosteles quadrilineatus]|uniref:monocarboxylate transporter 12-B-like n=1 Tax=Macrosteles quadrilineatus TaxID=74068 RepID=UPI0023E1767F|nr:monocarboxylate transporter 12-B-like [Macrosteles quadrilineatus]XP_054266563.1 monocarboxylate transporter 12-B-like [Macrosteles quadrilineatus]XP_054266565.1 monocarboxylate transporter 12-B-like [Macrosteles quadrilineatus]XP_054269065.1 monocarboxylate transporter 12-B-like [Macrosteles quadrilineatus]XP_054269066.1 monocarboxylate transporter 12-B-like [Macrosteles quadrilineatus]XP_054269067.1 monocarboxylate transporter 12-B-like [Macrosteles quadrilineatus]